MTIMTSYIVKVEEKAEAEADAKSELAQTRIALPLLISMLLTACSTVSHQPSPLAPVVTSQTATPVTPSSFIPRDLSIPVPMLPPANSGRGGYYLDDGPGDNPPPAEGLLSIPDPEVKIEPYSKTGNKPYAVFGATYVPITDSNTTFVQQGIGSWYGKKFQGKRTSSGEPYDMYKMTAAHPTLPIPSYARITHVSNGKQVIVRINDRGPFHSNRIIDLSYTAALKLGYLGKGSGELKVERILPEDIKRIAEEKRTQPKLSTQTSNNEVASSNMSPAIQTGEINKGFYLQLGAYAQADNAESARLQLMQNWKNTTLPQLQIMQSGILYRIYSGPFSTRQEAMNAANQTQDFIATKPVVVQH